MTNLPPLTEIEVLKKDEPKAEEPKKIIQVKERGRLAYRRFYKNTSGGLFRRRDLSPKIPHRP